MNKVLTVVKNSLPILILLAGSLHAQSQPLGLADVIKQSAREIEETLPQGSKVAVLNFNSPSKTFSEYVIEELGGELIEGRKITVVDRNNIDAILREMEFQSSGHVSDASIQQIGKMIGTQAIITGSFSDVGTNYRFRTRLINIETATVQRQITFELPRDDRQVAFLLGGERAIVAQVVPNVAESVTNFTTGQRWATFGLNLVLPGGGSAIIMKDWTGAIVTWSVVGVTTIISASLYAGDSKAGIELIHWSLGLLQGHMLTSTIWNTIRSITYDKKPPKTATTAVPVSGFNIAVFPDRKGNWQGSVVYSVGF